MSEIKSPSDQLRDAWQDDPYGSVVLYGADLIDEQVKTINSLRSELEASRHRVAELGEALGTLIYEITHLSARQDWVGPGEVYKTVILCQRVDEARATLEGKHPNAESLAAMQELEDGGGETFSSVDDLMRLKTEKE
jgi:hypothetical protein